MKLAVFVCVSVESSCSDAFDLEKRVNDNDFPANGTMNTPYGHHAGEELDHLLRVTPLGVEEVKTIPDFLHGDGVFLCAVLQDELF